jgi:signal transduction histidine kinase
MSLVPEPAALGFPVRDRADEASTLRTLNTFAVDVISIPSVEDLFWYVAQNVVGRLNFVDCVIYQADEDQTKLTQIAAWGNKNPYARSIINPLVIPFGRGITGQVALTRRAIIVDDLLRDKNYIPDTRPARSEICVPICFRGRVVGVIDSEHPDPNSFGEKELDVLNTVAAMMSAKLELLAEAERSREHYRDLVTAHAELVHETTNRKAVETKLFEARKLEGIGRLTGRFAHEFNNLLTVISGNLEFLELEGITPETKGLLLDARSAAARGAKLIRDMLAFAQRTHLVPVATDLNAFVLQTCKDSSTLSSGIDFALAENLWLVSLDREALRGALLNLLYNAQDSMLSAGRVEVITENIEFHLGDALSFATSLPPGRYVRLGVRDQGVGIPPTDLQKIFDPFFTTKVAGAGVGLGLSMVLGFIQQSEGAVVVQSEVGQGSMFELYFPIA